VCTRFTAIVLYAYISTNLSMYLCMFVHMHPCEQKFEVIKVPLCKKKKLNKVFAQLDFALMWLLFGGLKYEHGNSLQTS